MNPALLPILAFVAAVAAVVGVYSLVSDLYLRDRARVSSRIDEELRNRLRDRAKKSLALKELRDLLPAESAGDEVRPGLRQRFEAMVEQSGLELTPGRLLTIAGVSGLALGALGGLVRQDILVAAVGALTLNPDTGFVAVAGLTVSENDRETLGLPRLDPVALTVT